MRNKIMTVFVIISIFIVSSCEAWNSLKSKPSIDNWDLIEKKEVEKS